MTLRPPVAPHLAPCFSPRGAKGRVGEKAGQSGAPQAPSLSYYANLSLSGFQY